MIAIGCDHGALELKEQLIEHLKKRGVECKDYGTYTKDSCDYPVYAKKVFFRASVRKEFFFAEQGLE